VYPDGTMAALGEGMLNHTMLLDDAAKLGLRAYVDHGRTKIEGRTGDIIKAFAAQGCDVTRDGDNSYRVDSAGQYVACILHGTKGLDANPIASTIEPTWAYSFTAV
jgi:hypothetical protein